MHTHKNKAEVIGLNGYIQKKSFEYFCIQLRNLEDKMGIKCEYEG